MQDCFFERIRPIPIGCPLGELQPVFDENGKWIHNATKYEWFWVDVYEQTTDEGWQDAPDMHRLYDGPHFYPQETVLFLIDEGALFNPMLTISRGVGYRRTLDRHRIYATPSKRLRAFGALSKLIEGSAN